MPTAQHGRQAGGRSQWRDRPPREHFPPGGNAVAIFGNLKDISLLDLLPLLSGQQGKLSLRPKRGAELLLFLNNSRITCAKKGEAALPPHRVEEELFGLLDRPEAEFAFHIGDRPDRCLGRLDLRLEELLLKLSTLRDEIQSVAGALPLPDTVFAFADPGRAEGDPELRDFVRLAWSQLERGTSARELAGLLGMPLDRVRYLFYKLRALGVIQPLAQSPRLGRRGIARQLLGLLKRRFRTWSWSH